MEGHGFWVAFFQRQKLGVGLAGLDETALSSAANEDGREGLHGNPEEGAHQEVEKEEEVGYLGGRRRRRRRRRKRKEGEEEEEEVGLNSML